MKQSLAYYVANLQRDFARFCDEKLKELGLTRGLLFFILYVGRHPGCSPKELGDALGMDGGHAARSLAKLEEGGFLLREDNPKDRRAHLLRLTVRGEEAFRVSHELFAQWDAVALSELDAAEREVLLKLLRRVQKREDFLHV